MKTFTIPEFYKSPLISQVKQLRKSKDPRKKDFTPTVLDFGPVRIVLARHFGFCYGVENAIEISFKAVEENPGKRVYLLSQMIHNQEVNKDLTSRGVHFLMDTHGNEIIPLEKVTADDIVIIPAFGTTLAIEEQLTKKGIEVQKYNTTCPFVERVWNRAEKLGNEQYSIIIHGKHTHEETRATFSRSEAASPSLVIKDMKEAHLLGDFILGKLSEAEFKEIFAERISAGFDPQKHLQRIGVINQTTMLATETQAIADYLKQVMIQKFGESELKNHFADNRDTLCYATNENQESTYGLLQQNADLAIVIGGYNSSNTSHLVELCEEKMPTYFINSPDEILSQSSIQHFNLHTHQTQITNNYLPHKTPLNIVITSGASCPDALVEQVIQKLIAQFTDCKSMEEVIASIN